MFKSKKDYKIDLFLKKWKDHKLPSESLLFEYKDICKNILFKEQEDLINVTSLLKKNIELWARKHSPVYGSSFDYVEKKHLLDKSIWYVKSAETSSMATSGSTTGIPFEYLRWEPFLYFLECDNHYDLILDEFLIKRVPNILLFFDTFISSPDFFEVRNDSKNFMDHHGCKRKAKVHYVNFNRFKENQDYFFKELLEYVRCNEIDVFFTSSPRINSLCHYVKKYNFKGKIAKLLSNTNEKLLSQDLKFIQENELFDDICDHMRCWDGGATFFTCKEKNYHLMDNISWSEEKSSKLITTDYFSLGSPFVNYWNGDYCKIGNKYERCDCGRLYRDFEFLESRPFSIKGKNTIEIKEILKKFNINQVRCSPESLEIVTRYEVPKIDRENIDKSINDLLGTNDQSLKISYIIE